MTLDRAAARAALDALARGEDGAEHTIAPDAVFDVGAPVERLEGRDAIMSGFYAPLRAALGHCRRRDEIVIGGANRRAPGGDWVAAVSHYLGRFERPLFGVKPSSKLAFLRAGEFYRIEDGLIVEAKILIDLVDLLRQSGVEPFSVKLGAAITLPGPATHDGVLPRARPGEDRGARLGSSALDRVEAMLGDLVAFDPENFASEGQTGADGYWADDMLWYGPAGIDANYRWRGFVDDHRAPFLEAFPDRLGGNHYCRIGDGDYAAVSGWPSMTMTHKAPYLGVPATDRALTLRVMDFYRLEGAKIAENWVFLDLVDLFRQMGVDVLNG